MPPAAEFYIEVPFNEAACSAFVREAVIPQLRQVKDAFICKPMLGQSILAWLNEMRLEDGKIRLCYDYDTDWALFVNALSGQIPDWLSNQNVSRDVNKLFQMEFYRRHVLSEHHALADARALAYSYRPR